MESVRSKRDNTSEVLFKVRYGQHANYAKYASPSTPGPEISS